MTRLQERMFDRFAMWGIYLLAYGAIFLSGACMVQEYKFHTRHMHERLCWRDDCTSAYEYVP
jgi:hypothetical protein